MTETRASTPRHLWVIGIVAFLWSLMGAMDYVMTQTRNEAYMANFTPEQLSFFYGLPSLIVASWAIAVWGGLLGVILLLLRKSLAVWVLLASFVAMVITAIHNYGLSNGMEVVGDPFSLGFTALIFVVSLALFLYARTMQKRGVLV
ncbi:MAG: hypothetical protein OER80_07340 [Gammaproteobacteria bacterium]|nr:hypothetical protein [Gammaproteobacteria bacterium]MDH3767201.1 hypothetical protein [Gammaproteobacteria bacterium]